MGARISSGFTIIETMLFLAVTGLLVLGALIGTGTAVNTQRYRDAVESFKTVLQDQYAEVGSIKNDRTGEWSCGSDAVPIVGSERRGQSNCVIVGKYVTVNKTDLAIYTVIASQKGSGASTGSDLDKLKNQYNFNIVPAVTEVQTMEWGTRIAWPRSGDGSRPTDVQEERTLGVLVLRSPINGTVSTFTSNSIAMQPSDIRSQTFTDMMSTAPGQDAQTVCVRAPGLLAGGDMSVYINAAAANSSAIEVRSNDTSADLGVTTKC